MNGIAEELAAYITTLQCCDIRPYAVDMAKKCIYDSMGNMFSGRYSEMGRKVLAYIRAYSQHMVEEGLVSLVGGGWVTKEDAMTAHTVMARCSDLDDGDRFAMGHPGSVIIPAALAAGELKHRSGSEIITSIVSGYDVYCRVGKVINPTSYKERGFDSTGLCGSVACAATLGKLYGLSCGQMKNALGIAALFAGGLIEYQNDGTMGKVLCGCWAIRTGMRAVQMAGEGFTGPDKVFEGPKGFFQAFSNAPDSQDVLKDLGTDFKIREIYFKMHACMRGLHAAVDALLDICKNNGLVESDVVRIEVHTTSFVGRLSKPHPNTAIGAQCSLEFVLAVALHYGHISSEKILTDALKDHKFFETAEKVELVFDDAVDVYVKRHPSHWAAVKMVVYTKNGSRLEQWTPLPQGEAETPFDWEQLSSKFKGMISETPFAPYSKVLTDRIRSFENMDEWTGLYSPWSS